MESFNNIPLVKFDRADYKPNFIFVALVDGNYGVWVEIQPSESILAKCEEIRKQYKNMKLIWEKSDIERAKSGEIRTFDQYGNLLRYTSHNGWQVEYSQNEGERKLFRPKVVTDGEWYKYDPEMGIYIK